MNYLIFAYFKFKSDTYSSLMDFYSFQTVASTVTFRWSFNGDWPILHNFCSIDCLKGFFLSLMLFHQIILMLTLSKSFAAFLWNSLILEISYCYHFGILLQMNSRRCKLVVWLSLTCVTDAVSPDLFVAAFQLNPVDRYHGNSVQTC